MGSEGMRVKPLSRKWCCALLLLAVLCLGQTSGVYLMQVNNGSTTVASWSSYGRLKCDGTTVTCTASGSQVTLAAINLSRTPALPNGTTATTQTASDTSTDVATDAFVANNLASYQTTTTAQAAYSGHGSCTNQAVTAANANAGPTCTTITSAYVDSSIAPTTSLLPNSTAAPWLTVGHVSQTSGAPFSGSANKASFYGIILNAPKTTSQMTYFVGTTADNTSNTYDFGLYSGTSGGTCTLVTHLGATAGTTLAPAASAWHTVNWTGGSVTLPPGRYYLALTSSATTAQFTTGTDSAELTFLGSVGNVSIATGGSLPASVTCPADSYTTAGAFPAWSIN